MKHLVASTILGMIVLFSSFFVGCSNEILLTYDRNPPTLPDLSTMLEDLSLMDSDGVPPVLGDPDGLVSSEFGNYLVASDQAQSVTDAFWLLFEDPMVAYRTAGQFTPTQQPDGSFLWSYSFTNGGIEHTVFFFAQEMADRVEFRMEVSTNDPVLALDHLVWFVGQSTFDESAGNAQFYSLSGVTDMLSGGANAVPSDVPVVRIEWNHRPLDRQVRVVNTQVGGVDEGDALAIRVELLLTEMDYLDASTGEHYNITRNWDGAGSVTLPNYNDGNAACWDTERWNMTCPPTEPETKARSWRNTLHVCEVCFSFGACLLEDGPTGPVSNSDGWDVDKLD